MLSIQLQEPNQTFIVSQRILIVDDYPGLAEGLARWLRCFGNEVEVALDGLEGIAAAEKFRPDIIMLDINMPKLNGFEAAERIRQQPWGKSMTLVALTGYAGQEDRNRIRKLGFDAHLVKPFVYSQVAALLASCSTNRLSPIVHSVAIHRRA